RTQILDEKGKVILDLKRAIERANNINPKETHTYDAFKRIISNTTEDNNALDAASYEAKAENYGIAGPGNSCIDVAQAAFKSLVKDRGLDDNGKTPGENDLIPKNWFDKLETRVKKANENTDNNDKKIN